jgi:hypothetical protein
MHQYIYLDVEKHSLTPLEPLQPLLHILLVPLPLLLLLELHLLAKLLAFPFTTLLLRLGNARLLIEQPHPDAFHMRIALNVLSKVV